MEFMNPYLTKVSEIELLQRWVLTHSHLYYDLDKSLVKDSKFDQNSKQLAYMMQMFPDDNKRTKYFYAMYDFDGSSGFGYVQKLNSEHYANITSHAEYIMKRFGGRQRA